MSKIVPVRFISSLAVIGVAVPLLGVGCSEADSVVGEGGPMGDLCCDKFKVGADLTGVDFGLEGEIKGKFVAVAQAASDLSAVATMSLADVTLACQNIAMDLGADTEPPDGSKTGQAGAKAWCTLAAAQIKANFGASGKLASSIKLDYEPPKCSASFEAKANCEASCDVNVEAKCDLKAKLPKCEGGQLSVECEGSCEAEAGATLQCTGSCTGKCQGSCKASGGVAVACDGQCDGTCEADAEAGTSGIQADGSCKGKCEGSCTMKADAPAVECSGVCEGTCDAKCEAAGSIKARCDGKCSGDIAAPKCEGGELSGGCTADASADCQANCNASASAKAECKPPRVAVVAEAQAGLDADGALELQAAIASLEANLPNLLVVLQARGQAFAKGIGGVVTGAGALTSSAGSLSLQATACLPMIAAVVGEASANFKASLDAAVEVGASVGTK
ncbi:hypothetical protein ACFL5O_01770 [Myxococcota bacterium]